MPSLCHRVPFRPHQLAFAASAFVLSGLAQGAGFALNETSASSAGTAFAGRAGAAEDASAQAANPASISSLQHEQWTLGGAIVVPVGALSDYSAIALVSSSSLKPVPGGSGEDFVSPAFIPGGYYVRPINDKWTFGVAVYSPFGLVSDYNSDFVGRFLADRSEVVNVNFQPTFSYHINDQLSIGVGIFASYFQGTLTQQRFFGLESDDAIINRKIKVEGDAWRVGAKLGALWDNGTTSVGIAWTSEVDYKLKGTARVEGARPVIVPSILPLKGDGHLNISTPEMFEIGGSQKINENLTLVAGALWTGWSSFKEIKVVADEKFLSIAPGGVVSLVPEKWNDVWSYSIGARYQLNQEWLLRAGYAYDESPVDDKYRTARIPDTDRNWITFGASYKPSQPWTIDMAYGYLVPKTVKVDETHTSSGPADPALNYKGKYKMSAHIAMASLTYQY